VKVLQLCRQEQPLIAMMNRAGRSDRSKFRDGIVKPLLEAGLLELTIPDKPQSRLQRYRLTEEGMKALKMKRK
jgi:ATP-dependent DNA helicase RecG